MLTLSEQISAVAAAAQTVVIIHLNVFIYVDKINTIRNVLKLNTQALTSNIGHVTSVRKSVYALLTEVA